MVTKRAKSIEKRRQREARKATKGLPVANATPATELVRKLLEAGTTKAKYLRERMRG